MRILYIITKSTIGGAQTHIWQLASFVAGKGEQAAIMASPGGWLEGIAQKEGIKFYENPYLLNSFNPLNWEKAIGRIKKVVKEFNPNLISAHSSIAGFLTRVAIRGKIPTIFTAHGWGFTPGTPLLRRELILAAEKYSAKFAEKIICVSNFDKKLALRRNICGEEKLKVIHNGVEIQERGQEGGGESDQITFVGRFDKQKDPVLLIKAYKGLDKELQENNKLVFVGEGEKEKEMRKIIKGENIIIKDKMDRDGVFEELKKSKIFVLSSNWEGLPRSILEAMSCGVPVIASNVGGVSELLSEGVGILVEKGNERELFSALNNLLKCEELRSKIGERGRKKAAKKFSIEKTHRKTLEVYKEILE